MVGTVVANDIRRVALVQYLQLRDDLFLDGRLDLEVNAFSGQDGAGLFVANAVDDAAVARSKLHHLLELVVVAEFAKLLFAGKKWNVVKNSINGPSKISKYLSCIVIPFKRRTEEK